MKNLNADIRFLKRILAKVNSTSFIKQQEGVEMLRDQIAHMQNRHLTQQSSGHETPVVATCSNCGLEHRSHMAAANCCR